MIQQNCLTIVKYEENQFETFLSVTKFSVTKEKNTAISTSEKHAFGVADLWNITRKSKHASIKTHPLEL